MEPKKVRRVGKNRPEFKIQQEIIAFLRAREWFVMTIHGSVYQSGLPDLYATHALFRARWIEVKLPDMEGSHFTARQMEIFPQLCGHGAGVWVLTAATESEYRKLLGEPNWYTYLPVMRRGLKRKSR